MALGTNLKKQTGNRKEVPEDQPLNSGEGEVREKEPEQQVTLQQLNERVAESTGEKEDSLMLIVFFVGKEEYALPIGMVSEVVKTPKIAPIPQVPDFIKGVANIRGNVVTILDLELRMGLSNDPEKSPGHLMVIKSDDYRIAVGIDQVPNTLMVKKDEIDHSSELMLHATLDEMYIKGIVKKEQRMIIFIDILELMASETFDE